MSERPEDRRPDPRRDVPEQPDQRTETPTERGEELGVGTHDEDTVAGAIESAAPGSEEDLPDR